MCDGLARPELLRSTWRYRQGRRKANRCREKPSNDPARAWLSLPWRTPGAVFACSKSVHNESVSVKELQRAVSCREWGKFSADVDVVCLEGVLPPCERSQLVRDAQPMHGWYLRCAQSFSCIQRSKDVREMSRSW